MVERFIVEKDIKIFYCGSRIRVANIVVFIYTLVLDVNAFYNNFVFHNYL